MEGFLVYNTDSPRYICCYLRFSVHTIRENGVKQESILLFNNTFEFVTWKVFTGPCKLLAYNQKAASYNVIPAQSKIVVMWSIYWHFFSRPMPLPTTTSCPKTVFNHTRVVGSTTSQSRRKRWSEIRFELFSNSFCR